MNDKRAPKNGTLADIVEENEDLNICVVIKGADNFPGLWIPINKPQVEAAAVMAPLKKRKGGAVSQRCAPKEVFFTRCFPPERSMLRVKWCGRNTSGIALLGAI